MCTRERAAARAAHLFLEREDSAEQPRLLLERNLLYNFEQSTMHYIKY